MNLFANLGEAGEGLARSNAMAHGGQGVDPSVYNALRKQGDQGVKDAESDRAGKMKEFVRQYDVRKMIVDDMAKSGDAADKQRKAKFEAAMQDPDSQVSRNAVSGAREIFIDQPNVFKDGMSADEVYRISKLLQGKRNADAVGSGKADANSFRERGLKLREKEIGLREDRDKERIKRNAFEKYNSAVKLAASPTDKSVSRVKQSTVNASRAIDLMKMYGNNVAEWDEMPPNDFGLLSGELGALAKGGVATDHSMKKAEADTLKSEWNRLKQFWSGKPTGAELGEFIRNHRKYIELMIDTNMKVYSEWIKQVYEGARDEFDEDHDKRFRKEFGKYLDYGKPKDDLRVDLAPKSDAAPAAPKRIESVKGKTWKKNGMIYEDIGNGQLKLIGPDPDAQKVLKTNGGKAKSASQSY